MDNEKILELENVGYWYSTSKHILENISLHFCAGKIYAITGASGSGKTTFMSLLGGLDIPKEGSIRYKGDRYKQNRVMKDIEGNAYLLCFRTIIL